MGARRMPSGNDVIAMTKKLAIAGYGGSVRDSRTTDSAMTAELRWSRTSPKCWTIPAGAIVPAPNCPLLRLGGVRGACWHTSCDHSFVSRGRLPTE